MAFSFSRHKSWKPLVHLPALHATREYERLELSSGLKCILINDPSSHIISVALAVGAGSYMDSLVLGVAHLCEHIVCLGEQLVLLQKLLMGCGGSFSACTGSDQTTFGFQVSTFAHELAEPEHFLLDSALPMFASFFKPPRVSTSAVAREVAFVHDEHTMNKADLDKLLWHGLRLLANVNHPFARFSTGNKATLAGAAGLKRMITDHHACAFVPANSALVIKGPQSINHLRKVLLRAFGHLSHLPCPRPRPARHDIFLASDPNCIFIKAASRKIRLYFAMRIGLIKIPVVVQKILTNVLGDESSSSLCHYLRDTKQYIERLYAYTQAASINDTFFVLSMEATELGIFRLKTILAIVFYYIEEVMAKLPESTWASVAEEYVAIDEYLFMSTLDDDDAEEVALYAENLQQGVQFLRGDWDPAHLGKHSFAFYLAEFFGRSRLKLQVSDSNPKTPLQLRQNLAWAQDAFFDFDYIKFRYPFTEGNGLYPVQCPGLRVSSPIGNLCNVIPDLLEPHPIISSAKYRHINRTPEKPFLHHQTLTQEVWLVNTPLCPRSLASIYIDFRMLRKNAESLVLLEVLAAVVGQRLKSTFYNLELFGSTWGLYANIHGEPSLLVTAGGRLSTAIYILQTALQAIFSFSERTCHYNELKAARVHLRRKYEEYINEKGIKQIHVMIYQLLEQGIVLPEQRIHTLELLDAGSLQELSLYLQNGRGFTQMLMSGGFSEDQVNLLAKTCPSQPLTLHAFPERLLDSSLPLPKGAYYGFELPKADADPVNIVLYYVQISRRNNLHAYTLSKLLQQIILSTAYHNLRDKRGLAYTISTGMKFFRNHFGLHITVPTSKHLTGYVIEQIEAYMSDLEAILTDMSEALFDTTVKKPFLQAIADESDQEINPSSLFGSIKPLQGSENQSQDASFQRHWCALDQIIRKSYNFGSKGCEETVNLSTVQLLSLSDFRTFFGEKYAVKSPERSVLVLTLGHNESHDSRSRFSVGTKMMFRRERPRERRIFKTVHDFQEHTLHTF